MTLTKGTDEGTGAFPFPERIRAVNETIFEANSGGVRHYHCMDSVMAQKIVLDMFKKQIANG